MVDFQRKGQFIYNKLYKESNLTTSEDHERIARIIWSLGNLEFDSILKEYDNYLIGLQVCPKCYAYPLAAPDHQNEAAHCHNCNWREE